MRINWLNIHDDSVRFFENTSQTNWSKNQIVEKLIDIERHAIRNQEAEEKGKTVDP